MGLAQHAFTGLIASPQYPTNYRESCKHETEVKPGPDLWTSHQYKGPLLSHCANWWEDKIQVLVKNDLLNLYNDVATFCGYDLYPLLSIRRESRVLIKFTSNIVREGRFLLQYEQVYQYSLSSLSISWTVTHAMSSPSLLPINNHIMGTIINTIIIITTINFPVITRVVRLKKRAYYNSNISLYTQNQMRCITIFSNFYFLGSSVHCRHCYYF